jgi:hypothetical protein
MESNFNEDEVNLLILFLNQFMYFIFRIFKNFWKLFIINLKYSIIFYISKNQDINIFMNKKIQKLTKRI